MHSGHPRDALCLVYILYVAVLEIYACPLLGRSASRYLRGGPRAPKALPAFDIKAEGTLRLRAWARIGSRRIGIARSSTEVGMAPASPSLELNKRGRKLLAGKKRVRIRTQASFYVLGMRKTFSAVHMETIRKKAVKPPKQKRKRKRR